MHNPFRFLVVSSIGIMICLWHGTAAGHAFPVRCEPKTGETLHASPPQVRIWFDGALDPADSTIIVEDVKGRKVDRGDSGVNPADPKLLEVSLPTLQPGTYRIIWTVVGRDCHKTTGDYTFTIK